MHREIDGMAQLVNEHIVLVNTMDNTKLDKPGVLQKFGVGPERMTDYLALVGDTSDNIPGVAGVGPKTAAKWLQQYGDLDNLKARTALGRLVTIEDVIHATVFLLENRGVTGVNLRVDGGRMMK